MENLFEAHQILARLNGLVDKWHSEPVQETEMDPFLKIVETIQARNFELWHEEDKARDPHASSDEIAKVKRTIDSLNQRRNDGMERADEWVLSTLQKRGITAGQDAPLHSETVGSMVDRLSILALKVFHMREEAERENADEDHRDRCAARLRILEEQQKDLADCLAVLEKELVRGERRFKVYRQMKMYNDPTLNPVLRKKDNP